jgi:hypothetical protein
MASKRKLAKAMNDPLELLEEYLEEDNQVSSTSSKSSANGEEASNNTSVLRQSFSMGLNQATLQHFPDLALGHDKFVSACFNLTPSKSYFCFRNGRDLENNRNIIKLSEGGLDCMISHAPTVLQYVKGWEDLKKRSDEDKKFNVTVKNYPELPPPVVLDDDGVVQIIMNVFKYKDALGGGVTLKMIGADSIVKPFGMTGGTFRYFLNAHVPFFRSVYEEYAKMVESISLKEGVTRLRPTFVGSWKKN